MTATSIKLYKTAFYILCISRSSIFISLASPNTVVVSWSWIFNYVVLVSRIDRLRGIIKICRLQTLIQSLKHN